MGLFLNWIYCQRGATAVEYGLIAAGIALAIIGVLFTLGSSLESMFSTMSDAMTDVSDGIDIGS